MAVDGSEGGRDMVVLETRPAPGNLRVARYVDAAQRAPVPQREIEVGGRPRLRGNCPYNYCVVVPALDMLSP